MRYEEIVVDLDFDDNKKLSKIAKTIMNEGSIKDRKIIGSIFGTSKQYIDCKFHRDSFSFRDLVLLGYVNGCKFEFRSGNKRFVINPEKFLDVEDIEVANKLLKMKRKEYESLKEQLAEMKKKYGFEN